MTAAELKAKARERLAEIASERRRLDAEEVDLRRMLGESAAPVVPLIPPPLPAPSYPEPLYPAPIWIAPVGPSDWPIGPDRIICGQDVTP